MSKINFEKVEETIKDVAQTVIMPRFQNLHMGDIKFKSGDDPVTIADQEAESALAKRLLDLLPGSKVLGEEAFAADSGLLTQFSGESPVWIIDPLDGTKAFVAGDPVFGVIVALAEQNQTIAGWLYDPTSDEFVSAEKSAGAFFQGKKLRVLDEKPSILDEKTRFLGAKRIEKMVGTLGSRVRDAYEASPRAKEASACQPTWHRMLSACHDYASLVVQEPHFARRRPPMHFHGTYCTCTPWDNAAGVLIHAEAGGYSAHWNDEPFAPNHYGRGLLSAPDKESWLALREWILTFCKLPEC